MLEADCPHKDERKPAHRVDVAPIDSVHGSLRAGDGSGCQQGRIEIAGQLSGTAEQEVLLWQEDAVNRVKHYVAPAGEAESFSGCLTDCTKCIDLKSYCAA